MTDIPIVEPRFFIDHGMIHDRVTGKHVDTSPIEYDEGKFDTTPVDEACALLNQLAAADPLLKECVEALEVAKNAINRLEDGGPPTPPSDLAFIDATLAAMTKERNDYLFRT